MALYLRFGATSDIGRVRKKNDDSGYAGPHLVVVADGMGGAPAGDVASTIAIATIRRLDTEPAGDLLAALAAAIQVANERLGEAADEDPSVDGMGTTITAALFDGERIAVAHLGDSRGYLFRAGHLERITRDHTWVQTLVDEGRITEDEARHHSHRSLLLKVLDGRHDNEPDLDTYDVRAGDRILICSDGLSGFVPEERLARVLSIGTAQGSADELTRLALEGGSTDNVTVLVADVVADPPPAREPMVVGAAGERHRWALVRLRGWTHRDEPAPGEILMADPTIDPEELRYAPRAPRRLLWLRRTVLLLFAAAVIAGGLAVAYRWSQTQYFVAASNGKVAIFRGVNASLPGVSLNHVYRQEDLKLRNLPAVRRNQVQDGVAADSLARAERIVAELRGFAKYCAGKQDTAPATTNTPTMPPPTSSAPGTPKGNATTAPTTTTAPVTTPPATIPRSGAATTVAPPPALAPPTGPTDCPHPKGHHR